MTPEPPLGVLKVSHELLAQLLHLPAGTELCGVRLGPIWGATPGGIEFVVRHPDLKPVPADNVLPVVGLKIDSRWEPS